MKMFRILFLFVLPWTVFISCKKDEVAPQPTKTEILTGGKWKLTALTVSPAYSFNGELITDVFATYPPCLKDDFQTFSTDGTYTFDEGATKCDPDNPQTEVGIWTFDAGETQIILTTLDYSDVWKIKNLSTNAMTTEYNLTEAGVTYTLTATLQKSN